ncbi:hypothetical protein ACQEVI_06870 [Promicromonospora sp. CA-289599]|uniref:hypothetical protein n=1 Tax=Promicromonospora sp. CA-289599 TaxID=3240014 RepID=UPI003D93B88F
MNSSPGRPQGAQRQYPESGIDKFETIVAIVLIPFGCFFASFFAVIGAPRPYYCPDSCPDQAFADLAFTVGFLVMIFGPWICWLASSIWSVARVIRRKRGAAIMTGGLVTSIVLYVCTYLMLLAGIR